MGTQETRQPSPGIRTLIASVVTVGSVLALLGGCAASTSPGGASGVGSGVNGGTTAARTGAAGSLPGSVPGAASATGAAPGAGSIPALQDSNDGTEADEPRCPPTQPVTAAMLGGTASGTAGAAAGATTPARGTVAPPVSGPYPVASPLDDKPLADGAALQKVLDDTLPKLSNSPGAMATVWVPGTGVWRGTAGTSDPATGAPMDREAFFHMGSVTKTFTIMTVLRLVDQGRLRLDDPVGQWFPSMPDGATITVRQLASMTSGLGDYGSESQLFFDRMAREVGTARLTPDELVRFGLDLPRKSAPGEKFFYSNTATVMLSIIAGKVAGKPYPQVLQDQVLTPLGLTNTAFPPIDDPAPPQPIIHGFQCDDGTVRDVTGWNSSWASAAGAMTSTMNDLAVWAYQLGTGKLVRPETFAAQTEFFDLGAGNGYGTGLANFNGWWGHNGGMPGYTTYAVYNPKLNVVLIVSVNADFEVATGNAKADTPATALFKAFRDAITSTPR